MARHIQLWVHMAFVHMKCPAGRWQECAMGRMRAGLQGRWCFTDVFELGPLLRPLYGVGKYGLTVEVV